MSKYTQNKNRGETVVKGINYTMIIMIIVLVTTLSGGCMDSVEPIVNNSKNTGTEDTFGHGTILNDFDPSIVERIKQDWEEHFGSVLGRFDYYGTHNGYVAFFRAGPNLGAIYFKVAGTIFRFNNEAYIFLWKDSSFYEMIDAYRKGLITPENISNIGKIHRTSMRELWDRCDNSFNEWYFYTDDIDLIIE